jgi:radical SAM protein with 4Fe4S-binding SPASM domain
MTNTSEAVRPRQRRERNAYAVWELTLKCNLACEHCGSRAGKARDNELSTEEALGLVRQLAETGIDEVTIEGGEAFLRKDWFTIARAITDAGMSCSMVTGGYGVSRELARRMKEAGIVAVSVSIDGLEATHDSIRGRQGSFRYCFEALEHFREVGLEICTNTQINRLSVSDLPGLYERLHAAEVSVWQLQLTTPMGNAADRAWLLLQPAELDEVFKVLARIGMRAAEEGRVGLVPGSNLGYYGPYDHLIFPASKGRRWMGCVAGLAAIGIHADGSIKGCPTLPSEFVGGNIREHSLSEILETPELTFNTSAGKPEGLSHLRGFCGSCKHRVSCRGGCTQTATVLTGQRGDNPYCHFRALELAQRGLRERLVPRLLAKGRPFDHGAFRVVEEPLHAPWPAGDAHHFSYSQVTWPEGWARWQLPRERLDDGLASADV